MRACLESYASRGVFRGFTERTDGGGRVHYRFSWLARTPYELVYEPRTGALTFHDVLPEVPARSPLARSIRGFVKARSAADLPAHRRIDPVRASVRAFARNGSMRLQVVASHGHHAYGANRVVNLMHEVYLYLGRYHPEYLWDQYGLPQD